MQKPIQFSVIPLGEIPGRAPVTPVASDHIGSQWDEALSALKRRGDTHGLKVSAADKEERQRLKSTLQTFAKTQASPVAVLDDKASSGFFAWLSDREGRFAGPKRESIHRTRPT
jgi:hypothetical protein